MNIDVLRFNESCRLTEVALVQLYHCTRDITGWNVKSQHSLTWHVHRQGGGKRMLTDLQLSIPVL